MIGSVVNAARLSPQCCRPRHQPGSARTEAKLKHGPISGEREAREFLEIVVRSAQSIGVALDAQPRRANVLELRPGGLYVDSHLLKIGPLGHALDSPRTLARDRARRPATEDERLAKGITRHPVGSVNTRARALAHGVEARNRRPSVEIRLHSAY
jgi:hypothetical protein